MRAGAALTAALVLLLLPGASADAAGTGGVEITPVPGVVDGRQITSFRIEAPSSGRLQVPYALRNVTGTTRSARLYAASATRQPDGSFTVGGAGSSRHVLLRDEVVKLRADALERRTFTVRPAGEEVVYGALVVETGSQGAVVTRAATLVRLAPPGTAGLPGPVALSALVLALAVGAGVARSSRRSPGGSSTRLQ